MPKRQSAYSQILKEKQQEAEQSQLDSKTEKQLDVQESKQPDIQTPKNLDDKTASQQNSKTVEQKGVQTEEQQNSQPAKRQRIKATFYLTTEDIIAIDEMQTKQFRQTGKKPEKSELVSEAIQLLSKQQNS